MPGWPAAWMSRTILAPLVPCSWFPFLETRGEHILRSRATLNSRKHDVTDEAEPKDPGVWELARQAPCSLFSPKKRKLLSALRRSLDDGSRHDGDGCRWPGWPTASPSGARRNSPRCHLLLRLLLFRLGRLGCTAFAPIGLGR